MNVTDEFEQRVSVLDYPRLVRWMRQPWRYISGLTQRYVMNDLFQIDSKRQCQIFTGDEITVILPSGLDLFLTGIKTHDSEIRLVRFILNELPELIDRRNEPTLAVDCGAHLGYFSLILSRIADRVISFEPTSTVFPLLEANIRTVGNVETHQVVVSDRVQEVTFREMPVRYSEYNTAVKASVPEYLTGKVKETRRNTTTLDVVCNETGLVPRFVKIDVEGGELNVLRGATDIASQQSTIFAFEVRLERYEELYEPLFAMPQFKEYRLYGIGSSGDLLTVDDPKGWIESHKLESDNFLYIPK